MCEKRPPTLELFIGKHVVFVEGGHLLFSGIFSVVYIRHRSAG